MSSTEVWFRNPDAYVRELAEVGGQALKIAWDRGLLVKKRIDPHKHASLYFGKQEPWQVLMVGQQGSAHLDRDHDIDNPLAVYPTWEYGESAEMLEEILQNPAGLNRQFCSDLNIALDERPVFGQQHRVVITNLPDASTGPGRKFFAFLKGLQEDYPDAIIHVHGLYSYRIAFGMGYGAADMEARSTAAKGKVVAPSGREMKYEQMAKNPQWVTVLGFKPVDLATPRVRCMYNIKSALWCGENYTKLYKFKTAGEDVVDTASSGIDYKAVETNSHTSLPVKAKSGDQFTCNTCSLSNECKYNREGAVCSVPGAEPTSLARYFQTRDSELIIDGLGVLLSAQAKRLQNGMQEEEDFGDLNPEVTKMLNGLFKNGVQLAKLVNPALQGGTKVQVNVGSGSAVQVNNATPQELMGSIVRQLEARGIPRDKITPAMVEGMLAAMGNNNGNQQAAIDSHIVDHGTA